MQLSVCLVRDVESWGAQRGGGKKAYLKNSDFPYEARLSNTDNLLCL